MAGILLASNRSDQVVTLDGFTTFGSAPSSSSYPTERLAARPVRFAGIFRDLTASVDASGTGRTIALRKNGVDVATVSPADSTAQVVSSTQQQHYAVGDTFDLQLRGSGSAYKLYYATALFYSDVGHVAPVASARANTPLSVDYFSGPQASSFTTTETAAQQKTQTPFTFAGFMVQIDVASTVPSQNFWVRRNASVSGVNSSVTVPDSVTGVFEDVVFTDHFATGDLISIWIQLPDTAIRFRVGGWMIYDSVSNDVCAWNSSVSFSASAQYLPIIGYAAAPDATESNVSLAHGFRGTASNLRVFVSNNTLGSTATLALRVGGSTATQTVSILTSSSGYLSDTTHSDIFGRTDQCSYIFTGGTSGAVSLTTLLLNETPIFTSSPVDVILYPGQASSKDVKLRATGVYESSGPGVLADQAAHVVGAGVSSSTGTGALTRSATVVGAGVSKSTGAGALADQAAHAVGVGVSKSTGTGALANQAAHVVGAGVSSSTGTGALTRAATVVGAGVSSSTGSGALADQAAHVVSVGVSKSTGTGALAAQAAHAVGAGVSSSTGTGALTRPSTVAGAGTSSSAGTGALADQAAHVVGVGVSRSTGAGALASQSGAVAGVGTDSSTGAGAPAEQAAHVVGSGTSGSPGSGTLANQAAHVVGSGVSRSTGAGALADQAAIATGAGTSASVGSGALSCQGATASGSGSVSAADSGFLVCGSAHVVGVGVVSGGGTASGIGLIVAQIAALAGAGLSSSTGDGDLQAQSSRLVPTARVERVRLAGEVAASSRLEGVY